MKYEIWLKKARRRFLMKAIFLANGNQGVAAEALGIHRNTLYRWLIEAGVTDREIRMLRYSLPEFPSRGKVSKTPHKNIYRTERMKSNGPNRSAGDGAIAE